VIEGARSASRLRRAHPADAPTIAALWSIGLGGMWNETQVHEDLARSRTRSWVWERGGRALGFLHGQRNVVAFEVLGLVVAAEERRRGVGSALVEAAAGAARAAHLPCLELEVRAGDERALAFYRANGFIAVGRRARYYRDGEDALLMTRTLHGDA